MTPNPKAVEYRKALERGELDPNRTASTSAGMWAWMLQRGSALALIVLVALHLARTYNRTVQFLLLFVIAFHAALGLRVILLDFNLVAIRHHRWLLWGLLGLASAIALIVWFAIY
jgi:succinate dehydrogenase / fumarate reductase cytochrome b subunit